VLIFPPAKPDAIIASTLRFRADTRANKMTLGIGVYQDASGNTPIMRSVSKAEQRVIDRETTKAYRSPTGYQPFIDAALATVFPGSSRDMTGVQSVGGTGAVYLIAQSLALAGKTEIFIPSATWGNHNSISKGAGLALRHYTYPRSGIDFEATLAEFSAMPEGAPVIIHACGHNPTGIDPNAEQLTAMAAIIRERKLIPVIDAAYAGLCTSFEDDLKRIEILASAADQAYAAISFSKNMGLYRDRLGVAAFLGTSADEVNAARSTMAIVARQSYSMPPDQPALIAETVLHDSELRQDWVNEVNEVRDSINTQRDALSKELARNSNRDFDYITHGKGMFCELGLDDGMLAKLESEFALYLGPYGRVNISGIGANASFIVDCLKKAESI
jgi:aspartate/tyrosine/aromatic aminotransferase